MIPYLDFAGFQRRSRMPAADIAAVEASTPGYTAQQLAMWQSHVNARLRKRYGNSLPFGQQPAQPTPVGTAPPPITLTGQPVSGSLSLVVDILLGGAIGVATWRWSQDAGQTWTIGSTLAGSGTTPPTVSCSGTTPLPNPASLVAQITTAGALGAALFQWSNTGGTTWNIGAAMAGSGTSPPPVTLSGLSNLATPGQVQVQITSVGALGVAQFEYSLNGGTSWVTGLTTSAQAQALGSSGLSVSFGAGAYALNNLYTGQGIVTGANIPVDTGLQLTFGAGNYSANNAYTGQGIATAAAVPMTGTGVTVNFSAGNYGADNVYPCATPVPEVILAWLAKLTTPDIYAKRGVNPQDPQIVLIEKEADEAAALLKEAADGDTGLLDIPTVEDQGSAVSTGGPLGYSETSPYVWTDEQLAIAEGEDCNRGGTFQ